MFRGDIFLSPKVFQDFVRVKRQDDFVSPGLQERENIGKIDIRYLCHRRGTVSETSNPFSETEKALRLPKFPGNAKPGKLFRTPKII